MKTEPDLQQWFGGIDIYLFDQLLKGRFKPGMRVLDAGCGTGRNLIYFLQTGYEVFGVDESAQAISQMRRVATTLAPDLPVDNFRVEPVEQMSWESAVAPERAGSLAASSSEQESNHQETDKGFDIVLSSAVLHFARDEQHWQRMVDEMWRVLKPGGIFFARLASTIGLEQQVSLIEGKRYRLPDGSNRFLVDASMLKAVTAKLNGELIEPIKTTVVDNMRAMTTWVVRKN